MFVYSQHIICVSYFIIISDKLKDLTSGLIGPPGPPGEGKRGPRGKAGVPGPQGMLAN